MIERPGLEQIDGSGATRGQVPVWNPDNGGVWEPGTPTSGGSSSGVGELLMADGVTSPPVPIETEARDDWLYQD